MSARSKLVISKQRMAAKLLECEFFLGQIEETDRTEDFGHYLSAFLAALSTYTDLALITRYGKGTKQVRQRIMDNSPDLGFLLNARDVEVHREGVRIWLYRDASHYGRGLWSALAATRLKGSKLPRYTARYPRGPVPLNIEAVRHSQHDPTLGFIFHDSGQDVITCCRRALAAVRRIGR